MHPPDFPTNGIRQCHDAEVKNNLSLAQSECQFARRRLCCNAASEMYRNVQEFAEYQLSPIPL
jgi:hypothetical protein